MFAIVDIETTGGFGTNNCITEIAIVLHNGTAEEGRFQTLINPQSPINWYVQNMTGITNDMVATAPKFSVVAENIYNLIKDRVFIAHNVNFDYAFVKSHLKNAGYEIDLPKICTIKLSRKIFPGLPKYGLGSLTKHFNITNNARHRAIGDAEATMKLFEIILANDAHGEVEKLTKKRKAAQYLPPNLTTDVIATMPSLPGVYYFHNNKGKIIYVGKAINLKKRVTSHFSNNKSSKQKQDFLRGIYSITWKDCSSNLTAQIFESIEIKRLWPQFNKSQKHYEKQFGVFMFEDFLGYKRLAIDNKKKVLQPIAVFGLIVEARQMLFQFCNELDIHPAMFFLSKEAPVKLPSLKEHNAKVSQLIAAINKEKQTYLVHDGALHFVLIEEGRFYGMGRIEGLKMGDLLIQKATIKNNKKPTLQQKLEEIKKYLTPYSENLTVLSYVNKYVNDNPECVILL
jgi:DNA polymerase-3 subunit epsilon